MKIRGFINLNANKTIESFDENFKKFITPFLKKGEKLSLETLNRIFSENKFRFIEQLKSDERVEKTIPISYPNNKKKFIKFIIVPLKPKDILKGYKIMFFDVTKEIEMENEALHTNTVLETVMKIHHAITVDKTMKDLLKDIVYYLKNTRGYKATWIILFNKKMEVTNYTSAGFGEEFNQFIRDIKNGIYYNCIKCSMNNNEISIHHKSKETCENCPLYPLEPEGHVMSVPIMFRETILGSLFIVATKNFKFIPKEEFYFSSLVKDIGLALHNLNLEKKYRSAKENIKIKEKRYKDFFNNNISASAILLPNGKIIDCNRAFIELFGYKRKKDALGVNVNELYLDKTHRELFLNRIKKDKVVKNLPMKYKTVDGKIITVRENSIGIFGKSGKLKHLLVYLHDITREEELQTQLIQAQKMESLGRVTGGIAHDLNNMLVPIKGYTDILLLQTPKNSPIYSKLKEIEKATDRATALLKEILAFSKKQILNIETFDINKEIKRFSGILQKLIGEKIKFNILLEPKQLKINADKTQIDQILLNLAANARDAMPQGGTLTIETSEVNLDSDYTSKHINIQPGNYVLLAITDTGKGMDKTIVNMIFEPFFTTKPNGTGLGLSTVYGIVKQHNGYIIVYSEPGHGTTFKIYFQKSRRKTSKSSYGKTSAKDYIAGNERILLVEDEEDVRKVIKEILTQHGYTVYETGNPSEALEIAKQKGKIDILLTDVVLPDMNGRELSDSIKKENGDIKVLYMSGYTSNVIAHEKILDKGVNFIHKPFSITSLLIKIREILESD